MSTTNSHYIHKLKLKIQYLSQENKQLRAEITGQRPNLSHPVGEVIKFISAQTGITTDEMLSRTRKRDIVTARMLCMYIFRTYLNMQWTEIGRVFHRDHSTAIHGVAAITNQLFFPNSFESKILAEYQINSNNGTLNYEPKTSILDRNESIISEISRITGIKIDVIMGVSREKRIISARFAAFYVLNKLYNVSFSDIGRVFNLNHSAIIHGIRVFEQRSEIEENVEYQYIRQFNTISV